MEPDLTELLDLLANEVGRTLHEMVDTKDLEKRKTQSEVVRNLCESLGGFFAAAAGAMEGEFGEYDADLDDDAF